MFPFVEAASRGAETSPIEGGRFQEVSESSVSYQLAFALRPIFTVQHGKSATRPLRTVKNNKAPIHQASSGPKGQKPLFCSARAGVEMLCFKQSGFAQCPSGDPGKLIAARTNKQLPAKLAPSGHICLELGFVVLLGRPITWTILSSSLFQYRPG